MTLDLRTLFLTHSEPLRRSLTRQYGDPALAADLVQDAFVRLVQVQAQPQSTGTPGIENIRGYLARVVRNLALNHFRQVRQRRTNVVDAEDLAHVADDRPSAEAALDGQHRLNRLRDAMAELPERTRQVFVLTRVMGYSYPRAAQELGISESSVQKHLARALLHAMRHAS